MSDLDNTTFEIILIALGIHTVNYFIKQIIERKKKL